MSTKSEREEKQMSKNYMKDVAELKAIYQQMKELGWLDE